jgi:hypothetical protein
MKKTLLALALVASTFAASAMTVTGTAKYDYDRAESFPVSLHRGTVSVGFGFGALGTVDAGAVVDQARGYGAHATGDGFELGYTNGVKFGAFGLSGRAGYSRVADENGHINVTSLAANASYALTPTVSLVGGVEHLRLRTDIGNAIANRATIGAEVAVTKNVSVKALYARTRAEGYNANGLTTAVSYKF